MPPRTDYHVLSSLALHEDDMRRKGDQLGYLRRRGDSWYVSFRQWVRDAAGNVSWKQVERRVGPATGKERLSERAARMKAFEEHVAPANAVNAMPRGVATLEQFAAIRFEQDHLAKLSKNGRSHYRQMLRHILPTLGGMQLAEINARHVQMLVTAKVEAGYSSQTVAHIRNCLSGILRHARRLQFISGQLATEEVTLPALRHAERRALTWPQVRMLAEQMPERWRPLVVLLAQTGLRIGEAAGLRWQDVNLSDDWMVSDGDAVPPNSIVVLRAFVRGEIRPLKGRARVKKIPLTAETWVALMLHRESSQWTGAAQPVFAGSTGRPVDGHNVCRRSLRAAAKAIGAPWVTWHVLRHTCATLSDQAGLTVAEKQKLLGHATAAMSTHYTHPDMERMRLAWETVTGKPGKVN